MSLTPPQRKNFLSSHPLLQHVSNRQLLQQCSEQAESLRRNLLQGANILIVGGGTVHEAFLYDYMTSAHMNVYIMDHPETMWRKHAASGRISGFIPCNISVIDGVEQRVLDALRAANLDKTFFDAATSFHDGAMLASALVAKALNLHTNDPEAFFKATNKLLTRQTFEQANFAVTKYRLVQRVSEVADACHYVGFPLIVKPTSGHNSVGVQRAESIEEAINAFISCRRTWSKGQNETLLSEGKVMIEEYLDGDEFDVEVVLSNGKCVYAKVSDNWQQPPFFQEFGIHLPSICDQKKRQELELFAIKSLLELGFENGVKHVECRYTKAGPRLIEINPRMAGGQIQKGHELVWGVNLLEQHCFTVLRIPARPVIPEECLGFWINLLVNASYSGTVNREGWLDFLHDDSMVVELIYTVRKGDMVVGPEESVPTLLADVSLFSKQSQEKVNALALHILETTPVPIEEGKTTKKCDFFVPNDAFPFV